MDEHVRQVGISEQSKSKAATARADLRSCLVRLGEVEHASKVAIASPDDAWYQSMESAKAARKH